MIKAAVIGTGYLGQYHAEKYAKAKGAELVAVVDHNKGVAEKVASRVRSKALTDYREIVGLGVQCASVVTSTSSHYEIASWLLKNGVDVLVEKPMAVTLDEARSLIALAKENNRILQVGHLERFNPAFRAMKKVLNRPAFFEVRRITPFSGRGDDVDVVLDLMIHDIDIIAHLVGKPLVRVEAVGIPVLTGSIDVANARLTFSNGAIANVTASRAAFNSERTIRVFQPFLYISLDYGKKKLKIYKKSETETSGIGGKLFPKIDITEHTIEERDALDDEINSFLRCVVDRSTPEVTGEDGVRALELAEQIRRTIQNSMVTALEGLGVLPNEDLSSAIQILGQSGANIENRS